ncbi:MAG: molybdopterin cofactor-binding domain-containing protein [Litorilinea sp.]
MQIPLSIQINGAPQAVEIDPERTLLSVLRDDLGLTGAKYGCGEGKCGACTVLMDGEPVQACSVSAGAAAGSHLTTIEGLAQGGQLHPVQAAFVAEGALQCGYCTPGMILSAAALLETNPQPTDQEILRAMQDNICRCGSYPRILAAIRRAITASASGEGASDEGGIDGGVHTLPADVPVPARSIQAGDPLPVAPDSSAPDPTVTEGLFIAYPCPDLVAAVYGESPAPDPATRALTAIGPWVHIDADGAITAYVGKAEVGQNLRTTLAQIVAEELRVAAADVRIVLGDTGRTPFDLGTFGSRTTPITGAQLWRTGATARNLLLDLAAATWNVDRDGLTVENGAIRDSATGRSASFGDLARDRQLLHLVEVVDLDADSDADSDADAQPSAGMAASVPTAQSVWRVAGQPAPRVDAHCFVTGAHRFASDQRLPNLLHGKILRPPAFHATLESLDTRDAEAMDGVTVVHTDDFVGVTAPDELTAQRALDAIRARWRTTLQVSQPELFEYLKANPLELEGRRGPYLAVEGSVATALDSAHLAHTQSYTVDYIAHTPLEPRAALAQWTDAGSNDGQDARLTVWTGTQRPYGVRAELAAAFELPESQIRVIVPDTGAGYGGKHLGDAAIEAVRLAKAAGQPVKVVWTRQEEFTWAYFRPAGLIEITTGVDAEGHVSALELHNYNSGAAGIECLYDIPNRHIEYHPADAPLRQGAYRSLSATSNHFARETHLDELAHALGLDPLELRLRNLSHPRLLAVFRAAAERFGWGQATPAAQHGFGIAGGFDKGSYTAACVEVVVNPANRQVKVVRVVQAYDCGPVINPDTVRSQVEGAILQGLGGALFESVKFANGRILNPSFSGYRVPRFADMPTIETVLIDNREVAAVGAGETPIIAIAPAIGNAIFQATGVRLRAMPLAPRGVPMDVPLPATDAPTDAA